ncbi:hypothetical protein MASR1M65_15080 [Saprospiraceae bacterium]
MTVLCIVHFVATPQTAAGLNLRYAGPRSWFATLSASYFDKMYIDFNSDRRTNIAASDSMMLRNEQDNRTRKA